MTAIEHLGIQLRREAADKGFCTAQDDTLFVRATRYGNEWSLELCDEIPIGSATIGKWEMALGVPDDVEWRSTASERVWRCEWKGDEEPAPGGSRATWQGGKP